MHGIQVRSLVWEDSHVLWRNEACVPRDCALQQKSHHSEKLVHLNQTVAPLSATRQSCSKDPAQPEINKHSKEEEEGRG